MKVILNQDVSNLGQIGQVVNVRQGYARNFLMPRGFAIPANEKNESGLNRKIKLLEKKRDQVLSAAKGLASKLEKVSVTVAKQVGEDERIFGSVTTAEIEELLNNEGFKISKKDLLISEEIKKVGVYNIEAKVHSAVTAKFKVWVVAK